MRFPTTRLLVAVLTATLLAACGESGPRDRPALTADLERHLADAQAAQTAILDIWLALRDQREVSCAIRVEAPPPFTLRAEEAAAVPDAAPVLRALNAGQALVAASVSEWDAECQRAEPLVADAVLERGLHTAQAAATPLAEAQTALAAWRE